MTEEVGSLWRSKWSPLLFLTGIFLFVCLAQGIQWREFGMLDSGVWGHEAEYVLHNDPRQFDFLGAYGHPGGPIIEGTIVLHTLLGIPYDKAVLVFVTLFNSLVITAVCALTFILRRKSLWWVALLGVLSLNRLYDFATPPSATATVLVVLLCLLTLYIFEHKENIRSGHLALWGLVSGLLVATRADIGVFTSAIFLMVVIHAMGWRKTGTLIGWALLVFVAANPFMWSMPIQHPLDLVYKFVLHYADFAPSHLGLTAFVTSASLALISVFLSLQFILLRKKVVQPLPLFFVGTLLVMTGLFSAAFFTSQYQAIRYFLPILFIWEMFLPLFLFTLIDRVDLTFTSRAKDQLLVKNFFKWFVILLLFFYHLASIVLTLLVAKAFHLLPP